VNPWRRFLRAAARVLITLVVGVAATWGAFALWYQLPNEHALRVVGAVLWVVFGFSVLVALWSRRMAQGLGAFAAAFATLLVWWHFLPASNDHIWADDVAQLTSGVVADQQVTLRNVRNFDWRSDSDYTQRWETRHYDLDKLRSADSSKSSGSASRIGDALIIPRLHRPSERSRTRASLL